MKTNLQSESGQLLIVLILIMTVALAIGLSIIQKSLSDVSTATRTEQSSRAFSAAEAGIEQVLQNPGSTSFNINNANVSVNDVALKPATAVEGKPQDGLEFPPLAKEDVAQVWLADFTSTDNPPPAYYTQTKLDIYWGNSITDKTAILAKPLNYDATNGYQILPLKPFDADGSRAITNGFTAATCAGGVGSFYSVPTNYGPDRKFACYTQITIIPDTTKRPILLRIRLLYNTTSQPVAVRAVGVCPTGASSCVPYSIPMQGRIIDSSATAGDTKRTIRVFKQEKIVPHYFDYAIFSAGEIRKPTT